MIAMNYLVEVDLTKLFFSKKRDGEKTHAAQLTLIPYSLYHRRLQEKHHFKKKEISYKIQIFILKNTRRMIKHLKYLIREHWKWKISGNWAIS